MRRILNYIWLSQRKADDADDKEASQNPMPKKYTDNLINMANNYPTIEIQLWVDIALLNSAQSRFLEELSSANPNLAIMDLNTITAYQQDALFQKIEKLPHDEGDPIWQKVDYARVVVLHHQLTTDDADEVFYSDLDVIDPGITSPMIQTILNNHGMIFAKCNRNRLDQPYYLENQFMGFRHNSVAFLADELLPGVRQGIAKGQNGWSPLCRCVRQRFYNDQLLDNVTIKTAELPGPNSVGWSNGGHSISDIPSKMIITKEFSWMQTFSGFQVSELLKRYPKFLELSQISKTFDI